ncbi:uncharacterized protein LOC18439313 [Amborella trichopoda]|uniref:Uncharacterized protein n=1 Tax=Amborella trichopoda TaxID=13333 RepID=W1PV02_AMBTC|nr:uncharacterized protein LOC18439313 [Amborella trichopoda]ERN11125.1 hypothetical protein AMTR_s00024p00168400 [Amborella trichopoda]|eukprot:XP_011625274.1 uncharacterized protein LOC18439313 [Amborella trichopoda]
MGSEGFISQDMAEMLVKAGLFFGVQALVFLILSKSSNLFKTRMRSFKTVRSASMRRILAMISDDHTGESSPQHSPISTLKEQ